MELDEFRLDRTAARITTQENEPPAHEYWLRQPAEKRLSAIEFLRRQYAGTEQRLQRVYRITQRNAGTEEADENGGILSRFEETSPRSHVNP